MDHHQVQKNECQTLGKKKNKKVHETISVKGGHVTIIKSKKMNVKHLVKKKVHETNSVKGGHVTVIKGYTVQHPCNNELKLWSQTRLRPPATAEHLVERLWTVNQLAPRDSVVSVDHHPLELFPALHLRVRQFSIGQNLSQ